MSEEKPLHEVMEDLGLEPGQWVEAHNVEYEPEILAKQKLLLGNIKELLEGQIKKDQDAIQALTEQLNREKFGGGK